MNPEEAEALESRISARAVRLWSEVGKPEGGHARYMDQARELVAIHEVDPPTLDPVKAAQPAVEGASIQDNLGEFPTLRDQGDEMTFPEPEAEHDDHHQQAAEEVGDAERFPDCGGVGV